MLPQAAISDIIGIACSTPANCRPTAALPPSHSEKDGRSISGCYEVFGSFAQGSKGSAIISKRGDCGGSSSIYKGQLSKRFDRVWAAKIGPDDHGPYKNEWNDLVDAIRDDKPYNEAKRGIEASLVSSMGRMAAHTGREVTYDEILNCLHEFAPNVNKLTMDGPAPLLPNAGGKYPVPQPGIVTQREF